MQHFGLRSNSNGRKGRGLAVKSLAEWIPLGIVGPGPVLRLAEPTVHREGHVVGFYGFYTLGSTS